MTPESPSASDNIHIGWDENRCKRCEVCVTVCPKNNLELQNNQIVEVADCSRCAICIQFCPDQALTLLDEDPENE